MCKLVVKLAPHELVDTDAGASSATQRPSAVTRSLRKLFSARPPTMSMAHVLEVANAADNEARS